MNEVYLSLGSNEGERAGWLNKAIELIEAKCGSVLKKSALYETMAWGKTDQADFLNMAILVNTKFSPIKLLARIHEIESMLGRQRAIKWGPRTLDIDILLYGDAILNLPELTVPHPYMQERRFTLVPLNEIAPDVIHPALQKTIAELLESCPDKLEVSPIVRS